MRLYTFGNYYLSSIQQGIQGHHVGTELFLKYADPGAKRTLRQRQTATLLWDWARNHKTVVGLNGGNARDLQLLFEQLDVRRCPYPYAFFCEDQQSLAGAYTCIGVILPEWLYSRPQRHEYQTQAIFEHEWKLWLELHHPTEFDLWLVEILNKSSLAR
jgi:hypothetical protein